MWLIFFEWFKDKLGTFYKTEVNILNNQNIKNKRM